MNSPVTLGDAAGGPGDATAVFPVYLDNSDGFDVGAASLDILYDPAVFANPVCEIGPAGASAGKTVFYREEIPGVLKVGVFSDENNLSIPDGIVAYVVLELNSGAQAGVSVIEGDVTVSNPLGHEIDGGLTEGVFYRYSTDVSPEQILWENLSVTGPDLSGLYSVGATIKIVNAGSVKSPGGSLTLYVSSDNVLDASDIPMDGISVPAVEAGVSITRGGFFKTALPADTGAVYGIAVMETTAGKTAPSAAAIQSGIDFTGDWKDINVSGSALLRRYRINGRFGVRNRGYLTGKNLVAQVYYSVDDRLDSQDVPLISGGRSIPTLPPGRTSDVSFSYLFSNTNPSGGYVIFKADLNDAYRETDETNNVKAMPVSP